MLLNALDEANERYAESRREGVSPYTEEEAEVREALMDAVIGMGDKNAIAVLIDSALTNYSAQQALVAFGDEAIAPMLSEYEGAAEPFRRFILLNTMKQIVAGGNVGRSSIVAIADVAEQVLSEREQGSQWALVGSMDLAATINDPEIMAHVKSMSLDANAVKRRGIRDAQQVDDVMQYARGFVSNAILGQWRSYGRKCCQHALLAARPN